MSAFKSAPRLAVASRLLAGAGGGYLLAAAFTAAVSVGLPMARMDAVITGTVLSFAVYAGAVIWAFACASASRAWVGVAVPTLLFAAIATLLGPAP